MADIWNRNFNIIDAHTHIIEYISGFGCRGELRPIGNGRARWATGEEIELLAEGYGSKSFTYDRLLEEMNTYGVSKAVLLQGSLYGFGNDYVHEAQEKYPQRFFGMGTFDPYCSEYPRIMERLIRDFKFRGFKFEISKEFGLTGYHPDFKIDEDSMRPIWEYAQKENLIISLDLGTFNEPSFQIEGLSCIAKNYPGISFVVEHLFYPHLNHFDKFIKSLKILANRENIYFTVASIPNSTLPEKYPFPSACRYIEIAKEMVGVDRLMWGSDIPSAIVNLPYSDLINYIVESNLFNDCELEKIYSRNAIKVYRL